MVSILLSGFLTGLLLQIAIGPVFFYILNLSLQRTILDGLSAVVAVTIVDYLFITLAVLGVGKLLEKPKTKFVLGITSSIVLVLFGIAMMASGASNSVDSIATVHRASNCFSSFVSTFLLTISSPLTIVFWTGLFAAKAIEKGFMPKQLCLFGIAAGLATFVFLGSAILLLSSFKASIPLMFITISNLAVGTLLIAFGMLRLVKIVKQPA